MPGLLTGKVSVPIFNLSDVWRCGAAFVANAMPHRIADGDSVGTVVNFENSQDSGDKKCEKKE